MKHHSQSSSQGHPSIVCYASLPSRPTFQKKAQRTCSGLTETFRWGLDDSDFLLVALLSLAPTCSMRWLRVVASASLLPAGIVRESCLQLQVSAMRRTLVMSSGRWCFLLYDITCAWIDNLSPSILASSLLPSHAVHSFVVDSTRFAFQWTRGRLPRVPHKPSHSPAEVVDEWLNIRRRYGFESGQAGRHALTTFLSSSSSSSRSPWRDGAM